MLSNLDDLGRMAIEMTDAPRIAHGLLSLSKPTIARVNGHAMGLGATLALLCDIVFAVETAKIADPHVTVGLSAGDGGSLIWPHLVGYPRARHHLFTGEPLAGAEAQAAGLIHAAVPAEKLDEAVYAYAEKLAAKPLQALSATKRSLNMALCRQALADATAQIGLETLCMIAPDHREALLAIAEKRDPKFTHGRV
jgi:enoyl-CoA hydratase